MKKVLSVTLALVLCVLSLLSVDVKSNAAVSYIDTITVGQTWSGSWSSGYKTVRLNINESNLYRITINDYMQTGRVYIEIYNVTYDYNEGIIERQGSSSYVSDSILLESGCEYELTCYYYYTYSDTTRSANMSLVVNKDTSVKPTIPNCAISSSNMQLQLDDEETTWLSFKTSVAGEYTLYFSDLHAYISVFTSNYTFVDHADSEYYSDYYDEWSSRDGLVLNLAANTVYYIQISAYNYSSTKLSMTKNYREVQSIEIDGHYGNFTSFSNIDSDWFTYKIICTDGYTVSKLDIEDIEAVGYRAPYISFYEEVTINGNYYNRPGTQPVYCEYNGITTTYYIQIASLVDWVSELSAVGAGDTCEIVYESDEEQSYWWHINVAQSGIYGVWRYNSDDFSTNFDSYSIEIVDGNNNPVPYDSSINGWSLAAYTDYALNFVYTYDDYYSWNNIEFWLQKEADLPSGWSTTDYGWVYYENGVLATGWRYLGSSWYYFNEAGIMQTDWQYINYNWYYFSASGAMQTGWQYIGYNWYYFNGSGVMQTGWMQNGSIWYYFTPSGNMANGWELIGSTWYYFNAGGAMQTGWQYIGSNWYFFNGGGAMVTGWMQNGSIWYYFTPSGNMATGWQFIGSNWYYFHAGGNMATGWLDLGGTWYYLADGGNMLTGWQILGGNEYYFNASGALIS